MPYRIFISYSHNDDAPPIDGEGEGFVSALMRRVAHYLTTGGPPKPEFFRDIYEIRKSRPFTPIIEQHLQQSDALLIVLSRNWTSSEYCNHELELFRSQRSTESTQRVQQRIIIVGKQFLPVESFPQLLQDGAGHFFQEGHDFFRRARRAARLLCRVLPRGRQRAAAGVQPGRKRPSQRPTRTGRGGAAAQASSAAAIGAQRTQNFPRKARERHDRGVRAARGRAAGTWI